MRSLVGRQKGHHIGDIFRLAVAGRADAPEATCPVARLFVQLIRIMRDCIWSRQDRR